MASLTNIVRGDNINLEADLNTDITDWKIRCEIYDDCGNCIKLATLNSSGADSQIEVTDATNGIFIIKVAKNQTTNFDDKSFIEIEIENTSSEIFTVHQGEIQFKKEKIDWTDPTA